MAETEEKYQVDLAKRQENSEWNNGALEASCAGNCKIERRWLLWHVLILLQENMKNVENTVRYPTTMIYQADICDFNEFNQQGSLYLCIYYAKFHWVKICNVETNLK